MYLSNNVSSQQCIHGNNITANAIYLQGSAVTLRLLYFLNFGYTPRRFTIFLGIVTGIWESAKEDEVHFLCVFFAIGYLLMTSYFSVQVL